MQFRLVCVLLGALAFLTAGFEDATAARRFERSSASTATARGNLLTAEFAAKGLKLGSPVFIRIYKNNSRMELWVEQGARYVLFKTYGICRWAGGLGPKMYEGDNQSPEGVYHISSEDLIVNPRWHRAMNINYPNRFDVMNGRGGSGILIHGKCGSVGCFAIQDGNVEEVYDAVRAALHNGQARIPVLALPFRFAKYAPTVEDTLKMNDFWSDLRRADILFDRDRLPPTAYVCDGRYYFADRRGDSHRHAVHLPGCKLLDKPITAEEAQNFEDKAKSVFAAATERNKSLAHYSLEDSKSLVAASTTPIDQDPREMVDQVAKTCNPNQAQCRMLRVAMKSDTICPTKYPRCQTAPAAYTKSVECPLKYPRCRHFVGKDPRVAKLSGRSGAVNAKR
jgi:murein L,D-transpeptidase YafK